LSSAPACLVRTSIAVAPAANAVARVRKSRRWKLDIGDSYSEGNRECGKAILASEARSLNVRPSLDSRHPERVKGTPGPPRRPDPKKLWTFRPLENFLVDPHKSPSLTLNMETGVRASGRVFDLEASQCMGPPFRRLSTARSAPASVMTQLTAAVVICSASLRQRPSVFHQLVRWVRVSGPQIRQASRHQIGTGRHPEPGLYHPAAIRPRPLIDVLLLPRGPQGQA
jgi:hypothetical protein